MSTIHKLARYLINFICLTLSISLTIQFFFGLSENHVFRFAVVPAVIVIECLAQYILSMGRFCWKQRRIGRSLLLFVAYVWYLLVFALFSGMSYFTAEIAARETVMAKAEVNDSVLRQKWRQNNDLIATLNRQLETEAGTGYGSRSAEIMRQIDRLKAEQTALEAGFKTMTASSEFQSIDKFGALAATFGIPANILKIFVFGTIVMFIYLGLTLTNWEIKFDVTTVTTTVTDETEEEFSVCPICYDKFPSRNGKIYCSNRCKQMAYREGKTVTDKEV